MHRRILMAGVFVMAMAAPAAGQHWESPTFFSPHLRADLGAYLVNPDGGDLGAIGIWRQTAGINLGVRGGIGGRDNDRTVLVGAELFGPLSPEGMRGVELAWITGIGASINGVTALRIPVGISIGTTLGSNIQFTPYAHPRVALDVVTFERGDGEDETDTEFNFDVDVGADVAFTPSIVLRVGATLGDRDVFGVGLGFRTGTRSAIVR
jgi:hypothetical protein